MEDDNTPTGVDSTALAPAGETGLQTGATDLGGNSGVVGIAQQAADQATPDPIEAAITAIPENDDDLATYQNQPVHQIITGQRNQLRVLGSAIKELQPLRVFQPFGDPKVVESRLQIAKLLYNPALGRDGKPIRDPNTQATRLDPRPFVKHIDQTSPGLPEQLLVALLDLETENEQNQPEKLVSQLFRYYGLNFNRLDEYKNIDALTVKATGAVTPEELAEIPSQYHAAYRSIPPSIRAGWVAYDEADRTRMLEDYKGRLDDTKFREDMRKKEEQRLADERAEHAALVADQTEKYLDTVRRQRTASLIQSLAGQVTYSTDPITNKVMLGSLAATVAQLFDPAWRFVVVDEVLQPLGLKLDHTFDAALAKFEANASDYIANKLSGATGPAQTAEDEATTAANQLMAKIAIYALKIAAKQGATVAEKAATQAAKLATAITTGPKIGQQVPTGNGDQTLPAGMMPGSREAAEYIAQRTGLFTTSP